MISATAPAQPSLAPSWRRRHRGTPGRRRPSIYVCLSSAFPPYSESNITTKARKAQRKHKEERPSLFVSSLCPLCLCGEFISLLQFDHRLAVVEDVHRPAAAALERPGRVDAEGAVERAEHLGDRVAPVLGVLAAGAARADGLPH